jgi:3-hydroxyisobutyrate dehydrogenase
VVVAEEAFEVIENSAAAPSLIYRKNRYLAETQYPVSFTVALATKDMGLALELAKKNGIKMPQSEVTHRQLVSAAQSGYAERDMAAMLEFNSVS